MVNEYPLVSIVIPVYNGSNYLRDAIDSALAQTYPNIEVVVVNDGSTDEGATESIALLYGNRIRYYSKPNGGVASALNVGIRKMSGEYFSWLSHDDTYHPNKIEVQIEALRKHGDMKAVVHGDYDYVDVASGRTFPVSHGKIYTSAQLSHSVFSVLENVIHGCTMLIHRDHFERVGTFDPSLATTQDYDLWFRILRYQQSLYLGESLVSVRLHEEQGSRMLRPSKDYIREQGDLRLSFMKELTDDEMIEMYGSSYNFYYRMMHFLKSEGLEEAYRFAEQQFQLAEPPLHLTERIVYFTQYLRQLTAGKGKRIYIFCAGDYGLRLSYELRSRAVAVTGFSDNNPEKWGSKFDGIDCISPSQLEEYKEDSLVIVATRAPEAIVKQLKERGYPFVHTKQELDHLFFQIPPDRQWVSARERG